MRQCLVVVTGGPGAGKSSLIRELARRGFRAVPESGRAIIREEVARGGTALPWADRAAYANLMLQRDQRAFAEARRLPGPVLFDRGLPDILGYLTLCGLPVPDPLTRAVRRLRYDRQVFLAPWWEEIYVRDSERKQAPEEAAATCAVMAEVYTGLGYDLVELPKLPVEARADFVLSRLGIGRGDA